MNLRFLKTGLVLSASVLIGGCVSTTRQQPVTTPQVMATVPVAPAPLGPPTGAFPTAPPGAVMGPPPTGQAPCPNCGPGGQPQQPPPPIVIPSNGR
jgi:hypothetical protein